MNTSFPKKDNTFLKPADFQDQELPLTFKGWEKKPNIDREFGGKKVTWKESLKYQLRYSYPEFAMDPQTGEKLVGKDGNPWRNKNYDPKYPQGYSILYHFEEGQLDSGSLPLWNAFCRVQPEKGEKIIIGKTGKDKETKWKVRRVSNGHMAQSSELPDIQLNDIGGLPDGEEVPF